MSTIAMTIGPVVETLSLGRKTSEIWAASYLFSSFMRGVIGELRQVEGVRFLVPFVGDETLFKLPDDGIGKFHDRFILTSPTLTLDEVDAVVTRHKKALAAMTAAAIAKRDGKAVDEKAAERFISSYLQTFLLHSDSQDVAELSRRLDTLELHVPRLEDGALLHRFLRRDVVLKSDMAKNAFGGKPAFDSIPAIAAQEEDEEIEKRDSFKNAYKYIAVVHADGDNLGRAISASRSVEDVSRSLFRFNGMAAKTLADFGAQTLFAGGDDLLFFAPVLKKDGTTLFDLLDALANDYAGAMGSETTLSFGVSVTYYKYPLYEALERSRNALFGTAKKHPGKNAVAVAVQKHSGQSFGFTVGWDEAAYGAFSNLMREVLGEKSELPHALHHKLSGMEKLLIQTPLARVGALFDNLFNEELHKARFADGLKGVQQLLQALGTEAKAQEKLFAMLSLIKLLRGDR